MKPNVFSQVFLHLIFSPKYREALLQPKYRDKIFPYIAGIIKENGHKPIIINGMPDHIHILLGFGNKQTISDLVSQIKRSSSLFINNEKILPGNFQWQEGYGVFSCSKNNLNIVYEYIEKQQKHHSKYSFKDEYKNLLKEMEFEFKEDFLFQFFD